MNKTEREALDALLEGVRYLVRSSSRSLSDSLEETRWPLLDRLDRAREELTPIAATAPMKAGA